MHCKECLDRLDDFVDAALPDDVRAEFERHIASCTGCTRHFEREQQLRELLRDYGDAVVPMPDPDYFDRALARAAQAGAGQQRNRWLATGFGGAVAAGLAVLVVSGLLGTKPDTLPGVRDLPTVTMSLSEARTVNLVFSSAAPLEGATLTILLPPGVELAGFPGQRRISWQTSLARGKNLLPLTLIANTAVDGELQALLRHDEDDRRFHVRITAAREPSA